MRFVRFLSILAVVGCVVLQLTHDINAQAKNAKRDAKKAEQLARQASGAFVKRDYRAALDGYSQAAALSTTNADYRFWVGASHFYLNEYAASIPHLDAALSLGYKRPLDLYSIRWLAHFKEKNFDAALADVRQGLAIDANRIDLLQALADISYERGNYRDAVDAYEKVIARNPNTTADVYFYVAKSQASLGNIDAQISSAGEAIKRGTQYLGDAHLLIAEGYRKQKKSDMAIAAYLQAIASKPNTYSAYENLAELYKDQNRFSEAIDISRRALRVFPNDGQIYTNLAWFYSLSDKKEEAIQAAQAGIRFSPDKYMAYTNLCRAYNDVEKYEMAIRECNNALQRNANDGETFFYLGRAYELSGKNDEALGAYKKAVVNLLEFTKNNPESWDGFYLLGNAFRADNQLDRAITAYTRALELSPRFGRARYNLGIIQLRQKNKTAALEQYNRLLEVDKDLAERLKAEIDKS